MRGPRAALIGPPQAESAPWSCRVVVVVVISGDERGVPFIASLPSCQKPSLSASSCGRFADAVSPHELRHEWLE